MDSNTFQNKSIIYEGLYIWHVIFLEPTPQLCHNLLHLLVPSFITVSNFSMHPFFFPVYKNNTGEFKLLSSLSITQDLSRTNSNYFLHYFLYNLYRTWVECLSAFCIVYYTGLEKNDSNYFLHCVLYRVEQV